MQRRAHACLPACRRARVSACVHVCCARAPVGTRLQCIEAHLKDVTYDDRHVQTLVNYICEDVIQGLVELGKPFKYIGTRALLCSCCAGHTTCAPRLSPRRRSPPPTCSALLGGPKHGRRHPCHHLRVLRWSE
ncbi:hypothetical protein EON67_11965 [archaeon]|nr:MAG: hypothetical protein EON67_11965 [archaeon]